MDDETNTDDYMEIVLNTLEGLRDFFAYIDTQHQDFLDDVSVLGEKPEFEVAIQSGTIAYSRLTRHIETAEQEIINDGIPSEDTISQIQTYYNDFIRVYEILSVHTEERSETDITVADGHGEVSIPQELYASHQKLERLYEKALSLEERYQETRLDDLDQLADTAELTYAQLVTTKHKIAQLEKELLNDSISVDAATIAVLDGRIDEIHKTLTQIERSFKSLLPEASKKEKTTQIFSELQHHKQISKDSIVSKAILDNHEYQEIIKNRFSSAPAFEAALWRLIARIEEPQKLDKVLGIKHGSIFKEVLRGQTVGEVDFFNQQPGERIREVLNIMEIEDKVAYDYRTYVQWMHEFEYMKQVVPYDPDMLFDEMFVRSELDPYIE